MGAIVSELLAEALVRRRSPRAAPPFRWTSRAMTSRVDLSDKEAVYAALDEDSVSYSLDANVLLYASDKSSDRHERARRFVETCAAGPEILCLAWSTLMAYLRIATHPASLPRRSTPTKRSAMSRRLSGCRMRASCRSGTTFLDAYKQVAGDMPVRGNLVLTRTSRLSFSSTESGGSIPMTGTSRGSNRSTCGTVRLTVRRPRDPAYRR